MIKILWILLFFFSKSREKLHISRDKPYIFMKGDGKGKTTVTWSETSAQYYNYKSATLVVEAPDFIAFGITIKVSSHFQYLNQIRE